MVLTGALLLAALCEASAFTVSEPADTISVAAKTVDDGEDKKEGDEEKVHEEAQVYGEFQPFGHVDEAKKLTEAAVESSESTLKNMEKSVIDEEQRAVYRALTHLRGLYMASFDGMAKASVANIKEYGDKADWVKKHETKHLAEEEADVSKWAFPNKSD